MRITTTGHYRDTTIDVKLVLSALWTGMLFVFAYVDIFGFYRADVLNAALSGEVGATGLAVDQLFLTGTVVYVLLPSVMAVASLLLPPRVYRTANIVLACLCAATIVGTCVGEHWAYYLLGSLVEVVILAFVAHTAWTWPTT